MIRHLDPNVCDLLRSFNSRGVSYLVPGGYAVILHGYDRTTDDLDLWIAVDPKNADAVSAALVDFGLPPAPSPDAVTAEMLCRPGRVFRFGRPPTRIELLTGPSGVVFDACWSRRKEVTVAGVTFPAIGLGDLRENKRASGRPKDLADLAELPEA